MTTTPMSKSQYEEDEKILEISPNGRFIKYDEVLGKGAFKVVYKGFDQENGSEVAWYQINIDDRAVTKFPQLKENLMSEAALMKSLNHENLIKCHSSWVDDVNKNMNMITEFCSSGTLREFKKKHKNVNIKAIKNWAKQILKGLHYLHSQNPPIAHMDLKCDNVFINGNHGNVKIGDLGLATVIRPDTPRSVIGTPEFMAPEIYEKEYNELIDVYSFGMCMLELITCEYPYSECKNVAHIFKKVTTGVKPLALGKVKDPQVKGFIEKCLVPASERPSAAELLKDPFFSLQSLKGFKCESGVISSGVVPKSVSIPKPDSQVSASVASSYDKLSDRTSTASIKKTYPVSTVEFWRSTEQMQLRLRGKRIDNKTISFNLRIADLQSSVANCFEFIFDLEADDALQIAKEMVQGKDLTYQQAPIVVELIDSMLVELEPSWKPCYEYYKEFNVASGCRELGSKWQFSKAVL